MARRSRRRQVKKRQTKRVQRGGDGGFFSWEGIKSLFTRKAAPVAANQNFSAVNAMRAPMPAPVNNAEAVARRRAALNNITERRRLGQTHLVNLQRNIRNNQEVNAELAALGGPAAAPLGGRNVAVPENLQRRRNARNASATAYGAGANADTAGNYGQAYANSQATGRALSQQMTDAELEEQLASLGQVGGGLTAAQIDRLASNI